MLRERVGSMLLHLRHDGEVAVISIADFIGVDRRRIHEHISGTRREPVFAGVQGNPDTSAY